VSIWQPLAAWAAVPSDRPPSTVTSPADGSLVGTVPHGTPADVRAAVARARAAQPAWAEAGAWRRADVIARFGRAVAAAQEEVLDLVHAETGKARVHALDELLDVILNASYLSGHAPGHLKERRRRGAIPLLTTTRVRYTPKGVVGLITPWNYPLTLAASDALAALAAGNAVVLKPDSLTPFTALLMARLFADAGLPDGVFQVVTGAGRDLGTPLIEAADHIMFTGSSATGRQVAGQAAALLKSWSAELGGQNPMVGLAVADLARAAECAMAACFSTSGQLCISVERIYAVAEVYDRFVVELAERTRRLRLGAGPGWDVDMGPLISADHLAKVKGHVDDAVAKGARVVVGGRVREDLGPLFYEPTLLEGVDETMACYREETFGPVVALYRVADADEAVRRANDTEYGLNASVWGHAGALSVARRIRAGSVNVNEGYAATFGSTAAPMGGMGISGLGRRHGAEGVRGFTEPQTVSVQHLASIMAPAAIPRPAYATAMTAASGLLYATPTRLVRSLVQSCRGGAGVARSTGSAHGERRISEQISGGLKKILRFAQDDKKGCAQGDTRGFSLAGARVVVTGGGSGMGRLMALGAAARGADVTVWDLNAERAEAVAAEITARGLAGRWQAVDVTDPDAVLAAAEATGPADVLIHSAGVVGGRALTDESVAAVNRTIDVNLKALFWVTKAFLPGMLERDRGYVVTVASASGLMAGARMTDYAASKAGALAFNEALRNEFRQAGRHIGTLGVAPYYVNTGMFEGVKTRLPLILPLLEPEYVARRVLDGVEAGRRYLVLPRFVYSIALLRLMPPAGSDFFADLCGINASMADFAGRSGDRV
jgi:succinate-semialdehyde dehydrogenase/glutarate-semialdehyde dehydrogenase